MHARSVARDRETTKVKNRNLFKIEGNTSSGTIPGDMSRYLGSCRFYDGETAGLLTQRGPGCATYPTRIATPPHLQRAIVIPPELLQAIQSALGQGQPGANERGTGASKGRSVGALQRRSGAPRSSPPPLPLRPTHLSWRSPCLRASSAFFTSWYRLQCHS